MNTIFLIFLLSVFYSCEEEKNVTETSFPATKVFNLTLDESGIMWCGTDSGLVSYWMGEWKLHSDFGSFPTERINDLKMIPSGLSNQLWLASTFGAVLINTQDDYIISTDRYVSTDSGLANNYVLSVIPENKESIWFSTQEGINLLRSGKWYFENNWGDLKLNPATSLGVDFDGWIYAGTEGLGIARMRYEENIDGITGASYYNVEWAGIEEWEENPKGRLPSDTILSVYIDKNNNQWFGTPNGVAYHEGNESRRGFYSYDDTDGLVNNQVTVINEDSSGKMWFGTIKGVSSFDGNHWRSYGVENGLVNEHINDILIMPDGTVWVASDGGISTYNGSEWKNFTKLPDI